uniref:Uncharacterized protein n=1 Tax=Setaria digitata TaxID=48799 RepID=A0A915Q6I5_9BILA
MIDGGSYWRIILLKVKGATNQYCNFAVNVAKEHGSSNRHMQTVSVLLVSAVLFWWGCCNRSVDRNPKFNHHSATSDETGFATAPVNSVTRTPPISRTSKPYLGSAISPVLSKSHSVPRTSSEKSVEATQAESVKLTTQSHSKSRSLKLKKNLDSSQPEVVLQNDSHILKHIPLEAFIASILQRKDDQDSFATHVPKKRVARRSKEIKSRPPVRCDRDDYKTIPAYMLPSSTDDI